MKLCVAVEKEVVFYLQETKTLQKTIDIINRKIKSIMFKKLNISLMFLEMEQHSREQSQIGAVESHQTSLIKIVIKKHHKKKNENARTMFRQNLGPLMNLMHQ